MKNIPPDNITRKIFTHRSLCLLSVRVLVSCQECCSVARTHSRSVLKWQPNACECLQDPFKFLRCSAFDFPCENPKRVNNKAKLRLRPWLTSTHCSLWRRQCNSRQEKTVSKCVKMKSIWSIRVKCLVHIPISIYVSSAINSTGRTHKTVLFGLAGKRDVNWEWMCQLSVWLM